MKLENEFTVPAPVEQAWDVLLDLERVAPCLPGAAIESSERSGDERAARGGGEEHVGTMAVKIGPITARYRGTVRIEEADAAARRAVMRAQARDQRGQGTAAATITSTMEAVPEGTRVRVETDMRVTGPAAQFGRGVMQDVSAKMMGRFADCLAAEMAQAPAAAAATAGTGEAETEGQAPLPPGPAAAAAEAAAATSAAGPVASGPTAPPRPTADVLDLAEVSRGAVLRRAAPVIAAAAALALAVRVLRRR